MTERNSGLTPGYVNRLERRLKLWMVNATALSISGLIAVNSPKAPWFMQQTSVGQNEAIVFGWAIAGWISLLGVFEVSRQYSSFKDDLNYYDKILSQSENEYAVPEREGRQRQEFLCAFYNHLERLKDGEEV